MKPILCIFLKGVIHPEAMYKIKLDLPAELKDDYHVLIMSGETNDVKVFFEKDMVTLDKEKLEELLKLTDL